jgi:hypothetical protein
LTPTNIFGVCVHQLEDIWGAPKRAPTLVVLGPHEQACLGQSRQMSMDVRFRDLQFPRGDLCIQHGVRDQNVEESPGAASR